MFTYVLSLVNGFGFVELIHETQKFKANIGTLSRVIPHPTAKPNEDGSRLMILQGVKSWSELIKRLFRADKIKTMHFTVKIADEIIEMDQNDLVDFQQLSIFLDEEKPNVVVTSNLDWQLFTAMARLVMQGRLLTHIEKASKKKRPTSKKEVLKDWKYLK